MGDVITATRAILAALEGLTVGERGRVLGMLLALQGDAVTVTLGAAESTASSPPRNPPRAVRRDPATPERPQCLPKDGGPGGREVMPRILEALASRPDGMTIGELQSLLSLDRPAMLRGLTAGRVSLLLEASCKGKGARYTLTRKGRQEAA